MASHAHARDEVVGVTATRAFDLDRDALLPHTTAIEASAGTGKTWSIEQIVVRRVLAGLPMERMLLMTFTRIAAEEMAGRARAALARRLDETPASEVAARGLLERALLSFDSACITTIHGFCQKMLLEHASEAGTLGLKGWSLVPDADEAIAVACADAWAAAAMKDGILVLLASTLGTSRTPAIAVMRKRVASRDGGGRTPPLAAHEQNSIELWRSALSAFARMPGCAAALEALSASLLVKPRNAIESFTSALRLVASSTDPCDRDLAALGIALNDARDILASPETTREACQKKFQDETFALMSTDAWRARTSALVAAARAYDSACAQAIHRLESDALARLRDARGRGRGFTYHDLLVRMADAAASVDRFRSTVASRFDLVVVDEVQDTDPIQSEILARLFTGEAWKGSLYLVGDPKQSIYRFRGAELSSYLTLRHLAGDQRRSLRTSHRSDQVLLDAVERLFGVKSEFLNTEVSFEAVKSACTTRRMRMADGAEEPGMRFCFADEDSRIDEIAAWTARQIRRDLQRGITVAEATNPSKSDWRPMRASDIAVLCTANFQAQAILSALREERVPAVLVGRQSVFATPIAKDIFAIVASLAAPNDEGLARAAWATRLLGATGAEIERGGLALWDLTREAAETARRRSVATAVRELARARASLTLLASEPGAEEDECDFYHLLELIEANESAGSRGPDAIAAWLAESVATGDDTSDDGIRRRMAGAAHAVHVQTIHSSKGLTYGITWLPTLMLKVEKQNTTLSPEEWVEGRRLLYVALTRSRWQTNCVWIPRAECARSHLAPLIHARECSTVEKAHATAASRLGVAADARADLDALVRDSCGSMRIEPLECDVSDEPSSNAPTCLAEPARAPSVPSPEERVSFTRLTALADRGSDDDDERDLDATATSMRDAAAGAAASECDAALRALGLTGTRLGTALHSALEERDAFAALAPSAALQPLADAIARHAGFTERSRADSAAAAIKSALSQRIAATSWPSVAECASRTRGVFREMKLATEWSGTGADLAEAFAREPQPWAPIMAAHLRRMGARAMDGLFIGTLDLVCTQHGQWFIYDYKSNDLGRVPTAYDATTLDGASLTPLDYAMVASRYPLQAALYSAALRRWLVSRGQVERHESPLVGGVAYLFLRGMDGARPGSGVWTWTPSMETLDALDRVLSCAECDKA
jgi:exodeoxyribonuclease V beta subunit